eukprot:m51a1_g9980 putative structural maintenance of chromosomes protein 2 (1232) ;mRNA; r:11484-15738
MYIEEIIIDGFKSYAQRTVVGKFDPRFNAITGLNGSGKSNILDSICFVLGISQLSQVRVKNLQELVYKQGQAGVTKASVSVVFNNSDRSTSPPGYEQFDKITVTRQVIMGGRSKYLINGSTKPPSTVQNLFHSVQLNVNNPHFLIMQGRITKVLNMRPEEIRGLIEEAAGTRMYEAKKQATLRTIQKKQHKVDEINKMLADEIEPTLARLRAERKQYQEFSSNKAESERLARQIHAFEYSEALRRARSTDAERDAAAELEKARGARAALAERIEELRGRVAELSKQKERELEAATRALDEAVTAAAEGAVRAASEHSHRAQVLEQEAAQLGALQRSLAEIEEATAAKRARGDKARGALLKEDQKSDKLEAQLRELQREFETLSIGLSIGGGKGDADSATDHAHRAQKQRTDAEAELKQIEMQGKHYAKEMADKRKEMAKAETAVRKIREELEGAKAEAEELADRMSRVGFDEARLEELVQLKRQKDAEIAVLRDRVDGLSARLSQLQFEYRDPEQGFDRSRVKGLVAELVSVKRKEHATAIEVTAGGRLYFVVVEDEETGKKLLKGGQLRRRVTIIPLNKISARTLGPRQLASAERLVGQGHVSLALSLVGYGDDVRSAMAFVFGSTLVCQSSADASKVAFDADVRARTVTLVGDVYDPSGTLTGGSRTSERPILLDLAELNAAREDLARMQDEVRAAAEEIARLQEAGRGCAALKQQHELAQHKARIAEQRLAGSAHSLLATQIAELEKRTEDGKKRAEEVAQARDEASERIAELEARVGASKGASREEELKRLEKEIAKAKDALARTSGAHNEAKRTAEKEVLELEALEQEAGTLREQIATEEKAVEKLRATAEAAAAELAKAEKEHTQAKQKLEKKREETQCQNKAIAELVGKRDSAARDMAAEEVKEKRAEVRLARLEKEREDAERFVGEMRAKHQWLAEDEKKLGKAGTDYDWASFNAAKARERLAQLTAEQEKLGKTVNRKVVHMLDKAEKDYDELVLKKDTIEKDKAQIESVIEQLDLKKKLTLDKTWRRVDGDFTSIFQTLLPGAQAKLEPPEGKTFVEGLEVRVAFNGVWKESLSELSGGQRSLLALSLILALLRFKPAPMYILDEIDSALDPSHTQNIGQMLRKHFGNSQFIVVSLKPGMFQNASVLFRTKCEDGVSSVTRVCGQENLDREADILTAAAAAPSEEPPKKKTRGKKAESDAEDSGAEDGFAKPDKQSKRRRV